MEYPWYELVENKKDITQGDILINCPVPILKQIPKEEEGDTVQAEIEYVDGIILTQACNLENRKVENVIICSITSKKDFEKLMEGQGKSPKQIAKMLEGIIKGRQNAYHIINEYKTDAFKQDYYIINFKDIFSVLVDLAMSVAENSGRRLRLCPPYREHLSQAFARFFMRVGLPINIRFEK